MKNKQQKILIADDEPSLLIPIAEELAAEYEVFIASDGEEAVQVAIDKLPDLILLDIVMPKLDGFDVCKIFKNNPRTKDIPIIFITSKSEVEDETIGLEYGAVDYITKPFYLSIFKSRVNTHLALKMKSDMLEEMVYIDGLTNIYNRRYFDDNLIKEWKRADRSNVKLTLIMIDIDFFKKYNDNYGHSKGDECLKEIAKILKDSILRPSDFIARYGGEEFVVLLPDISNHGAKVVSNRLVKNIISAKIRHEFSECSDYVTISAGTCTLLKNISKFKPNDLIEKADEMLYHAKESGRNQFQTTILE